MVVVGQVFVEYLLKNFSDREVSAHACFGNAKRTDHCAVNAFTGVVERICCLHFMVLNACHVSGQVNIFLKDVIKHVKKDHSSDAIQVRL